MKKDKTYDEVMDRIAKVLENSGATNEEAFIILEMMQQRMMVDAMKKLKVL